MSNSNQKRPITTDPISILLDSLEDLRVSLQHAESDKKRSSYLEMYDKFNRISDHGRNCTYSQKARALFLKTDYDRVKQDILVVLEAIRKTDGNEDFGR